MEKGKGVTIELLSKAPGCYKGLEESAAIIEPAK